MPGFMKSVLLAAAIAGASCSLCENRQLAEYPSPDGAQKIVVFERNCGATTAFSTQASLVAANSRGVSGGGNVFVADSNHGAAPAGSGGGPELRVRWISSDTVELAYHPKARLFRSEQRVRGTNIRYASLQ